MTQRIRAQWITALALTLVFAIAAGPAALAGGGAYRVTNLVSNVEGRAAHKDPNLVNGWGVAFNPFGFVWVASNGMGVAALYDGNGVPQSLVVQIPGGNPTGIVFNGSTNDFIVTRGGVSGPAAFIFATEAGIISAWVPSIDRNHAIPVVDNSGKDAIYKGLALGADGNRFLLYATDFHNQRIDVFDRTFSPVTVPGGFADTSVPRDYGPFGIQNIGGSIYVTYAKRDEAGEDDVKGRGLGVVNAFTAEGFLIQRIAKGGELNAPWGLALAPADFGEFSNHLLIGNFGDGTINAFNLARGKFDGPLAKADGNPIVIPGLWGLAFEIGRAHV